MRLITDQDIDEALELAQELNKSFPDQAEPYFFLGLLSFFFHDRGRAVELIEHAHALAPSVREYADALANILAQMGRHADGLYYAKLATALHPHEHLTQLLPVQFRNYFRSLAVAAPSYHFPTALSLFNARKIDECANHCEMELRANATHHGAHDLLGRCYLLMNDPLRARRAFHSAINFAPQKGVYRLHMAECLGQIGLYDQAVQALDAAKSLSESDPAILNDARALLHTFPAPYQAQLDEDLAHLRETDPGIYKMEFPYESDEDGKLSIGYLSGNLDTQRVLTYLQPILAYRDKQRTEVHVFFTRANRGSRVQYLETLVDSWTDAHDIDDDTLFAIMRGNNLDVLIDVDGLAPERRQALIAAQPAPLVLCWPSARARSNLPHELSLDAFLERHGEKTALPVTRDPIPNTDAPSPSPCKLQGFVTFGATSEMASINAQTIALWTRVLQGHPNSQLLLGARGPIPPETATYIADLFGDHGLSGRVQFHRFIKSDGLSEYGSAFLDDIDVLLDTVPSSEADLLSEALWMGVPVVSLSHDTHGLRSFGSLVLKQAGKSDWTAATEDDYVKIAMGLASDPDQLVNTRANLRSEAQSSLLFSPRKVTKMFETLLIEAKQ